MAAIKIELETLEQLVDEIQNVVAKVEKIEAALTEPKFYTIDETANLLGWSAPTVQDLFNRGDFPSCDFGKKKVVEVTALKNYFSVPRRKDAS